MPSFTEQTQYVLDSLEDRNILANSHLDTVDDLITDVRTAIVAAVGALTDLEIGFDQAALDAIIGTAPTFGGTPPDPVNYSALNFTKVGYNDPATPPAYTAYAGIFTPDTTTIGTVDDVLPTDDAYEAPTSIVTWITDPDEHGTEFNAPSTSLVGVPTSATISTTPVTIEFSDPTAAPPILPTPSTSVDAVSLVFADPTATAPEVPTGLELSIAEVGSAFVPPTAVAPTLPTIEDIAITPIDLTFTPSSLEAPVVPSSETIDVSGINVTYVPPTAAPQTIPAADDVAIGAIEWDAIFERAAAQQLRASTAEIQAANSGAALRGMALPSVVSAGMLSVANQRAMDRVSLLAETNAVEYAKSRREDIIALAKLGVENYIAQWEEQIKSEAERRAYAELASRFKFDQAKHNLSLLQLSVEYYVSTWKAKVESELARLQYAQFAYKQQFDQATVNVDNAVKIGGLQVNLYEVASKMGLESELARLQYAQFEFKQEFDQAAQNADIGIKVGGLANQIYETQSKTQLETLLAKLQYAQFEFKQAYDKVALTVDSETKLAGLGVQSYTAEIKAELDEALARLQYAQFEFKQAYDVDAQNAEASIKVGSVNVQAYSEQVKKSLDGERIRLAALDQDVKNLIAVKTQNADLTAKLAGIEGQSKGDHLRAFTALEGTKISRAEALARLAQTNTNAAQEFELRKAQIDQAGYVDVNQRLLDVEKLKFSNVEMQNKNELTKIIEDKNNEYKTAETQAKVYVADAQVYASEVSAYTQMGDLAYKINVDVSRIEAEYNLKKTELALTNNIGHLVDMVQVYAQLVNALLSASDVSLSSGATIGISTPFKHNPSAGEVLTTAN